MIPGQDFESGDSFSSNISSGYKDEKILWNFGYFLWVVEFNNDFQCTWEIWNQCLSERK